MSESVNKEAAELATQPACQPECCKHLPPGISECQILQTAIHGTAESASAMLAALHGMLLFMSPEDREQVLRDSPLRHQVAIFYDWLRFVKDADQRSTH